MPLPMKIASRPKFLSRAFDGFRASSSHRIGPQNLDPGFASILPIQWPRGIPHILMEESQCLMFKSLVFLT